MKIYSKILLTLCFAATFFACKFEEPDLFEKSAAERLAESQAEYFQTLCSAPNGWKFDYFPTAEHQGFNFVMKFLPSSKVEMASKNSLTGNKFTRDSCAFAVIADNGPVLTLNTFTDAGTFHQFADPIESAGGSQGVGWGGDYEFIIISATPEKVVLKGKKRGLYFTLVPVLAGQTWESYFATIDEMKNYLFDGRVDLVLKNNNDTVYTLFSGHTGIFKYLPLGGDMILNLKEMPFITTEKGIHLPQLFNIADTKLTIQDFTLNAEKTKLVANENPDLTIIPPTPVSYIKDGINNKQEYYIVLTDDKMSASLKNIIDRIKVSLAAVSRTLNSVSVKYYSDRNSVVVYINILRSGGENEAYWDYGISSSTSDKITLSFKNTYDQAGQLFYQNYDGFSDLANFLNATFTASTESIFTLSQIKLVNSNNPEQWFYIK